MRGHGRGRGAYSYSRGRGAVARSMQPAGSLHMARTGSTANSNNSADDSNGSEQGPRSPRGMVTSSVGGLDADNDRPAKLRRLSTQRSAQSIPPQTSSGEGDSDELPPYQAAYFPDTVVDDADAEGDDLAGAEEETQEEKAEFDSDAPQQSQDAESPAPPKRGGWANRRGKRRKGWNLRKVNKIANGVPMQTTPLRAEDAPDRPVPGGILDRLPGRRRAAHPDPLVEADLRRQLELKVAYRSVVKALKPVLAELARRTAEELESSEQAYQEAEDYDAIVVELDERLEERLAILDAFFDEDKARFEREYQAKQQIVKERYQNLWFDRQDDRLLEAQHEMMTTIREIEMEEDSDATENEDGEILPVLFSKQPPHFHRIKLDRKFYPRGKFFVETDAAWQDLELRRTFVEAHRGSDRESFVRHPKGIAIYDAEKRAIATAKYNVVQLAEAGEEVEYLAAKKAREESYARATGFQAILEAAEMHAIVPLTPATQPRIKQQTPASVKFRPSLDDMVIENDSFKRAPLSPRMGGGLPRDHQRHVPHLPATQHATQPGMEYHQRIHPDQRPLHADQAAQGPVNGFILVQQQQQQQQQHQQQQQQHQQHQQQQQHQQHQQQDRGYGHSMYPPPQEHVQASELVPPTHTGPPPAASGFIPPFSVAPSGSEKQGKQRKRPGPRAHYAAPENRQQPLPPFQPQQGWSPFSNSMGPPMYIPDYIKGGEPGQSAGEDHSPASGPPTNAADSPALSQHKRSMKLTPQMGLPSLAPAHNRGPTPERPPPGRTSYDRQTSPRESSFQVGLPRPDAAGPPPPPPPNKYESSGQQNQLPSFLQPLQPSPFQQPAPYQGQYYQQGYYGSYSGPQGPSASQQAPASASRRRDSKASSEQTSRAPPLGGHPPTLLPHPGRESFFSYNDQRQPPPPPTSQSMIFRYNHGPPAPAASTGAGTHRPRSTQPIQPLPPPPPPPAVSGPPVLPNPSQFPTFNAGPPPLNGPLPLPRQHPGQRLGSQTLLPATMDPSRHSSHPSDRGGSHSRNTSREVEVPSRHSHSGSLSYSSHPQSHRPPSMSHQEQHGSPLQRPGSVQSRHLSHGGPPGYNAPPPPPPSLPPPAPSLGLPRPPSSTGPGAAAQHAWPGFSPPSGPPKFAWQAPATGSSWGSQAAQAAPGAGATFGLPSGPHLPPISALAPSVRGGSDAAEAMGGRDRSPPPRVVKSEDGTESTREQASVPPSETKRAD